MMRATGREQGSLLEENKQITIYPYRLTLKVFSREMRAGHCLRLWSKSGGTLSRKNRCTLEYRASDGEAKSRLIASTDSAVGDTR